LRSEQKIGKEIADWFTVSKLPGPGGGGFGDGRDSEFIVQSAATVCWVPRCFERGSRRAPRCPAGRGRHSARGRGRGGGGKRISVHGAVYGELFEHPRGKNNHISLPVPIQHSLSFIWTVHPSTASPLRRVWPENFGSDTDPWQLRGRGDNFSQTGPPDNFPYPPTTSRGEKGCTHPLFPTIHPRRSPIPGQGRTAAAV